MTSTRLRLTHRSPDLTSSHIFRNFGEDLWQLTREDKRWSVDLEEIDRSDHSFDVVVRSSTLKRSVAIIGDLLSRHLLQGKVRVDILNED